MPNKKSDWAQGIIRAIADALTGFMTLQARMGMSPAYSEYLLYDPVVRVARYWGWKPLGEFAVSSGGGSGDKRRIDFLLRHPRFARRVIAIEVKWFIDPRKSLKVERDLTKLRGSLDGGGGVSPRRFLVLAGRHRVERRKMSEVHPWPPSSSNLPKKPYYHTVYRTSRTQYGVTVFEIQSR